MNLWEASQMNDQWFIAILFLPCFHYRSRATPFIYHHNIRHRTRVCHILKRLDNGFVTHKMDLTKGSIFHPGYFFFLSHIIISTYTPASCAQWGPYVFQWWHIISCFSHPAYWIWNRTITKIIWGCYISPPYWVKNVGLVILIIHSPSILGLKRAGVLTIFN